MISWFQSNNRGLLPALTAILTFFVIGCSKGAEPEPRSSNLPQSTTSSIPLFYTREPERYSATRIVTTTRAGLTQRVETTLIARDGENRREEYRSADGASVVYLETSQGRFLVLPAKKLFADLVDGNASSPPDTTEQGLEQVRGEAKYEVLATESLNGKSTTKYRVTPAGHSSSSSETLVWVDDTLRMPIRTETRTHGQDNMLVVTELRDITNEVDKNVFQLGNDYKKVDAKTFRAAQVKPRE